MKLVKNLVLALVLASVLAISAPAGELNTPGAVARSDPTATAVHGYFRRWNRCLRPQC